MYSLGFLICVVAVATATTQPEIPEDATDEVKEQMTLPPYTESVARANFFTQKVILSEFSDAILSCGGCVLPPPVSVLQLFYATGLLSGMQGSALCDACGDLSWEAIKSVRFTLLSFVLDSFLTFGRLLCVELPC